MQHTVEAEKLVTSMESLGGAKKLDKVALSTNKKKET